MRERLDGKFGKTLLLASGDSQAQPYVKCNSEVHVRKLFLGIQIRGVCDDPPTVLVSVHVPYVMRMTQNVFSVDLLDELHLQVRRLSFEVACDRVDLFLGSG